MGIITSKSAKKQNNKLQEKTNTDDTDTNQNHDIENLELTEDVKEVSADIPITEAEKLRHIYKKEQAQTPATILSNNDCVKPKEVDIKQQNIILHDNQSQVSESNIEDISDVCKNETSKIDEKIVENGTVHEGPGISPMRAVGLNSLNTIVTSPRPFVKPIKPSIPKTDMMIIDGSYLSNQVSKHCPDLLQQASENVGGELKPLSQGKLGEKNQIRNELEKQGILTTETRAAASEQVDPKQEGIISELRQVGIVQKVTADDVYTMSTGLPKRRPPPRLNHLPPLEKEPTTPQDEIVKGICEKRDTINDILKGSDFGEKKEKKDDIESKQNDTEPSEKKEISEHASEYFGTIGVENVGDAEKLKLKLFDVDML